MKTSEQGFTLVELMVVILIVGLLAAVAIPMLVGNIRRAREIKATADVEQIHDSVTRYYVEYAKWPENIDDLVRVGESGEMPVLEELPRDPWGTPYRYHRPGPDGRPFEVVSSGPDGVEATGDDISSLSSLRSTPSRKAG